MKPTTIQEYIDLAPKEAQSKLKEMWQIIKGKAPGATEGLKWGMPALSYKRILVAFAGFQHHVGFYPTPSAIEAFQDQLKNYVSAKGSVQFPLDKPLPTTLIKEMTAFRVKESLDKDQLWKPEY